MKKEKELSKKEYENKIEKLKLQNGVKRVVCNILTKEEDMKVLNEWFDKGSKVKLANGKEIIVR